MAPTFSFEWNTEVLDLTHTLALWLKKFRAEGLLCFLQALWRSLGLKGCCVCCRPWLKKFRAEGLLCFLQAL